MDELRTAVRSAVQQSGAPEVIVIDDGSTDGTAQMIASEFPAVRLVRHETSSGLIVRRNEGARLAIGEIIFSIDDDAIFSTPEVVGQTLREFSDERVGAVAIPYLEPHKENRLLQRAPAANGLWVTSQFIGTAHALRRDLFLKLGGYREHLIHQGEESDYCLRLLNAGFVVRLGSADPINHYESPRRDFRRMDYFGARNAILFVGQNVPWPALPVHLLATTFNVLRWTLQPGRFFLRLCAVLAGYGWCTTHWKERQAVSATAYQMHRRLKQSEPVAFAEVEKILPTAGKWHTSSTPEQINLRALDVLRGLLAVYVLAGHARWLLWTGHANWQEGSHSATANALAKAGASLRYGHEAVIVFFVLSGFFIHLRTAQSQAAGEVVRFSGGDFFRRRGRRLLPPYALALLVTMGADFVGRQICPALYSGQIGDWRLDANFAHKNYSVAAVVPALVGLPSSFGEDFGTNGPLWSLAFEVVYYALYPLWMMLRQRTGVAAYMVPVLVGVAAVMVPQLHFASAVLANWPLWIAGAALAEWMSRSGENKLGLLALPVASILVMATLIANHSVRLPFYLVGGVAAVMFFATRPLSFLRFLPVQLVEKLGVASYSIYIFHFPLMVLVSAFVFSRLGARPAHGWFALLGGATVLASAYGFYWVCERHFLNRTAGRAKPGTSAKA